MRRTCRITALVLLVVCHPGWGLAQSTDDLPTIQQNQLELAEQYRQLEDKLFKLHQFEKTNDPLRAKLLQSAFLKSQERMTAQQLAQAAAALGAADLKQAEAEQRAALERLNELLVLLQADSRLKQLREQQQSVQEQLREVNRILWIQAGIRGQTEAGVALPRLAKSEAQAAEQAARLAEAMQSSQQLDAQPGNPPIESGPPDLEPNPAAPDNLPQQENDLSGGSPSSGQRVAGARARMDAARQALQQAQREQAQQAMQDAEAELEAARQELEVILKQLREEEIAQTLEQLESRFRRMLELQVRLNEATGKLARQPANERGTEFDVRAARLGNDQREVQAIADKAQRLLSEDGSSLALPAAVDKLIQDMAQVANRLSVAQLGAITLEIQEDIVESLTDILQALVASRESLEENKGQAGESNPQGSAADAALVSQIAELKMLRGMQQQVYRRHERYSRQVAESEDPRAAATDPDIVAALQRLAVRQARLTEIARELVNEQNQ